VFHELARHKEARIEEGHLMPDHVHMCISIPPKYAVASVVGYIKGKSALAIARNFLSRKRNFSGENFWARGFLSRPWVWMKIRFGTISGAKNKRTNVWSNFAWVWTAPL
jgi:putative transposase